MIRRTRALVAAIVLAVPLVVALNAAQASAAPAAAACQVRANLPSRIAIDRDSVVVPVSLSGCAGTLEWAAADVYGPSGIAGSLFWNGSRTEYLDVYSDIVPGSYRTIDGNGYTQASDPVGWQYTSTTVKFGTRAGIAVSRRGSTVSITVASYRFAAYSGFVGYGNHVVGIQHSLSPYGPWSTISYAKVNSAGRVTVSKTAPAARYYRAFFGDTGSFFGSYSGAVRR